jgi:peptidoglycan/LPS O-acetylase OafA/YrhL
MGRLKLIDGLRGLAATAVMLDHLLARTPANWLGSRGYLGVAVFFVLSGFVIAMVIGERPISLSFLGRFALRRMIRLDIPYWTSIALGVLLIALAAHLGVAKKFPSGAQVIAHMFYLQEILGYEEISAVYWTLCFEVQFYLSLIVILWIAQALRLSIRSDAFLLAFLVSITLSVFMHIGVASAPRGLMFPFWWAFGLGALCYWVVADKISHEYFFAALSFVCVSAVAHRGDWRITAALTAGLLFWGAHRGAMARWLADPVTQFLGRISYSLYLLHGFVGWSAQSLALRYLSTWGAFAVGIASSLISAYVAYKLIERPSIRVSHRVRLETSQVPVVPAATVNPGS